MRSARRRFACRRLLLESRWLLGGGLRAEGDGSPRDAATSCISDDSPNRSSNLAIGCKTPCWIASNPLSTRRTADASRIGTRRRIPPDSASRRPPPRRGCPTCSASALPSACRPHQFYTGRFVSGTVRHQRSRAATRPAIAPRAHSPGYLRHDCGLRSDLLRCPRWSFASWCSIHNAPAHVQSLKYGSAAGMAQPRPCPSSPPRSPAASGALSALGGRSSCLPGPCARRLGAQPAKGNPPRAANPKAPRCAFPRWPPQLCEKPRHWCGDLL